MEWLKKFMRGRYGQDEFSIALIALTLVTAIAVAFTRLPWLRLISLVPFGYYIFRILSRNIDARLRENRWFLGWWRPVVKWFADRFTMLKQSKTHRFFRCNGCGQMLRVPRGKGKIKITCPKCGASTVKKT